jgi:hypothetical protein
MQGENIVNSRGKVIDVAGGIDNENQNIIVTTRTNKMSQRWTIVYVDEDKGTPKKGSYMQDIGFYALRPFYIESLAGGKRFVSLMGNNAVISKQTGEVNQQFYFDPATMSIKTKSQNNRSLNIANNGRSTNLELNSSSGQWW